MRNNRTPYEWDKWCLARERIVEELKEYYRACTTGELAPQLLALSKKARLWGALKTRFYGTYRHCRHAGDRPLALDDSMTTLKSLIMVSALLVGGAGAFCATANELPDVGGWPPVAAAPGPAASIPARTARHHG